ncbi:Conjugal transfer,TrbC [mine drainage metagenome]|uniref:Conjugal transfer,TrbC n=1 Tax=mine drainage metagenome TaxID=410659 RepID=T1C417_9ZZZZ
MKHLHRRPSRPRFTINLDSPWIASPIVALGALAVPALAQAQGNMPWMGALTEVETALGGPVARAIATILVIILGFLIAFGEVRGFLGLFLRVTFGLTLVFAAATWLNMLIPGF